ncbi:MAG TPA: GMC family oxidoreductase [Thermomicrobiaceae bacterium]|nr:GMC family oxidoreductase [Thermomicrobiaceae bacterium]
MRLHVNLASNWLLDVEMKEYRPAEEVDFCIVGTGAGGGVLAQRLARDGFSVVALDAGPWHDSEHDMVSDEAGSGPLYWNDIRVSGGSEPLEFGANNSGRGVGGSTIHFAAFMPRLHPSDFRVRTLDGVAADWPLDYADLAPYYARMEREYPVTGPALYPWGAPHGYPYASLEAGTAGQMLIKGCVALGIPVVAGGPVGIPAGRVGKRPHCIMRGFCLLGCKVGAKSSTLVSFIPDAIAHGAEIRSSCMAFDVPLDDDGRARGVRYYRTLDDGQVIEEEQRARSVVVAGYAIESPRLLLESTSARFPDGLANSSGLVGKFLMAQAAPVVWGRFEEPIRQYKAPPACALTEEFYETDPHNDFVRGYALQSVAPLPIAMAHLLTESGYWGEALLQRMQLYNHYACLGVLGEILPDERNFVALDPEVKDQYGLPAPRAEFNLFPNDLKLMEAGTARAEAVLRAAGAVEVGFVRRYAHLVGTCRMGFSPRDSVVDQYCRAWDVPNLFVCDGSVLPTQGSSNPGLTISALAARTAEWIRDHAPNGELSHRPQAEPPVLHGSPGRAAKLWSMLGWIARSEQEPAGAVADWEQDEGEGR